MAIKHPTVKAPGNTLAAIADWNANHTIDAGTILRSATLIVAASDSLDTTNADYFCDGVADEVQIQAAIDALPVTGGLVKLMDGTFNIITTITVLKNNVTIEGCGRNTVIFLVAGSNTYMIQVSDATQRYGFRMTNLKLDGNRANNTGNWDGIYIYDIDYIKIDHCWIENAGSGVNGYAIDTPVDGPQFFVISNNHFYNCGSGTVGGGIGGSFMYYGSISGNVFLDCSYYSIRGLKDSIISGNIFDGGVYSIYDVRDCDITGNKSVGATNFVYCFSYNISITGNCSLGKIYVSGERCTVSGNTVELYGIYSSGANCSIVGNIITRTASSVSSIEIRGSNTTVSGNSIYDDTSNNAAIYLLNANHCSVTGNTMTKVDREGIEINGGDHNTISSNSIYNCSEDANNTYSGILLTGTATYNVITGNRVSGDAANKHAYGYREAAAADDWNLIDGNTFTDAVTANLSVQGVNSITGDNIAP